MVTTCQDHKLMIKVSHPPGLFTDNVWRCTPQNKKMHRLRIWWHFKCYSQKGTTGVYRTDWQAQKCSNLNLTHDDKQDPYPHDHQDSDIGQHKGPQTQHTLTVNHNMGTNMTMHARPAGDGCMLLTANYCQKARPKHVMLIIPIPCTLEYKSFTQPLGQTGDRWRVPGKSFGSLQRQFDRYYALTTGSRKQASWML